LVPNPDKRPTISQVIQILDNWNQLPSIKLTEEALEIKNKQGGKI
jgi:hypothetical protein